MIKVLECLENIIGITESQCQCLISGLTQNEIDALKVSKSGLYTDDLDGGIHLKTLSGVDACKGFAKLSLDARSEAIKRTSHDVVLMLNQKFSKKKDPFNGSIGTLTISQPHIMLKRYGGMKLKPKDLSDGLLTITGGSIALSYNGSVDLLLVKAFVGSNIGTLIETIPVTSSSSGFVNFQLQSPLNLTLQSEKQAVEYYILFDRTLLAGGQPMNNKTSCNCGTAEKYLKQYIDVLGVELDNIEQLTNASTDGFAHGLSLNISISCSNNNFICREFNENDAVSLVLAYCVLFKTQELIIESVLGSPEINRYTMMHREYLWGKRNHFRAEYESRIKYLGMDGVIDINDTDCYICKDETMFYGGIMA